MRAAAFLTTTLAVLLIPTEAQALVNPSLQPMHLYKRYSVVLVAEVVAADMTDADSDVESGRI